MFHCLAVRLNSVFNYYLGIALKYIKPEYKQDIIKYYINVYGDDSLNSMRDLHVFAQIVNILDNEDKLSDTLKAHGSTTEVTYTDAILQRCNIKLVKGNDMKVAVTAFLESLHSIVPNSIGGSLPNEDFYYIPQE